MKVPPLTAGLRVAFAEFEDFAEACYLALGIGDGKLTPRQREIARAMQYGTDREFIGCFRGIGKSYLAGLYAIWCGFMDPTEIILILSGSPDKAVEISQFMRKIIAHPALPWLHFMQPQKGQRNGVGAWDFGPCDVKQSASVTISTVLAGIQGKRATKVILDDCEQKGNSESELKRRKLMSHMMDTGNMLVPERDCKILCLGTYQSLNSIYRELTAERGFHGLIIPARVPSSGDGYDGLLSDGVMEMMADPANHGKPSDTRFSDEHLRQQELDNGPLDWMVQMMMSTTISDRLAHQLHLEDLVVWDGVDDFSAPAGILAGRSQKERLDEMPCYGLPGDSFYGPAQVDESDSIPYLSVIMAIDPAGNNGEDETAYVVLGAVPGALYLLDAGGFLEGSSPETCQSLARIAKRYRVRQYVIESNLHSFPPLFQQNAYPIHKAAIETRPAYTQKVGRIVGTLDPVLSNGQLIVKKQLLENEYQEALKKGHGGGRNGERKVRSRLLQFQLAMLKVTEPKDGGLEHDDRLDALALGVAELAQTFLSSDAQRQLAAQEAARQEEAVEGWGDDSLDTFLGRRRSRNARGRFAEPRRMLRRRRGG